jgi:SNF2 family DNA or RNA helicase
VHEAKISCRKREDLEVSAEVLAGYDVVVITQSLLQTMKKDCPFNYVCWYRIVIDEGHVMGSEDSNQFKFAAKMFTTRRWICSGTPTPGSRHFLCSLLMNALQTLLQ